MALRTLFDRLPIVGALANAASSRVQRELRKRFFPGSSAYWEQRYAKGGTSGPGSYNRLAEYKANVLNGFVAERGVSSVIEFGCGDGHQLSLARYPSYIGLDVSPTAIQLCTSRFSADPTKSFYLYQSLAFVDNHRLFCADLSLSLDVIYHLVEDRMFDAYMRHLFAAARRHVIIYSSNFDSPGERHQRNRRFTDWIAAMQPGWKLEAQLPNPHPYDPSDPENTSLASFFIYTTEK